MNTKLTKLICLCLVVVMALTVFAACNKTEENVTSAATTDAVTEAPSTEETTEETTKVEETSSEAPTTDLGSTEVPTTESTTSEETSIEESSSEEETTTEEITTSYMESLGLKAENLEDMMQNIFAGNEVKNETVFVIDKGETRKLLYPATEIISVTNYYGDITYVEGVDYVLENGGIKILEGSSINAITSEVYYKPSDQMLQIKTDNGNKWVYWGEGTAMVQHQISVTYKHESTWAGFNQDCNSKIYDSLIKKLEAGEDVTFIFYGDSITCGATSSWFSGYAPNQYSYSMLFTNAVADLFGYTVNYVDVSHLHSLIKPTPEAYVGGDRGTITYINPSVGGWTSADGVSNFGTFVKPYIEEYGCDFFSVAFGMNDAAVNPATTGENIKKILTSVHELDADAVAMIVTTMVPNNLATNGWYGNQENQEKAMTKFANQLKAAGMPTAITKMTSMSLSVLDYKEFLDYTGNNINHPNDFFNRVYAQTLLQSLIGYENIK